MSELKREDAELLSAVQCLYRKIILRLMDSGKTVSTMESCTSGLIASLLTDTEGASAVFRGSLIAYSNEQKIAFGISKEILDTYTVYSKEAAQAMAELVRKMTGTDMGIGITGCFGRPDPANNSGVPGEVCFCIDFGNEKFCDKICLAEEGSRFRSKLLAAQTIAERILEREEKA